MHCTTDLNHFNQNPTNTTMGHSKFNYGRYFKICHFHWSFLQDINDKNVVNSLVGSCDGMFL
jgi:hypothetical protein